MRYHDTFTRMAKIKKKKTLILNPDKNPHTNIYNSFFIIAKNLEIAKMCLTRSRDKQIVVYPYS